MSIPSSNKILDVNPHSLGLSNNADVTSFTDDVGVDWEFDNNEPVYKTNLQNSKHGFDFSGGARLRTVSNINLSSVSTITVYAVVKNRATGLNTIFSFGVLTGGVGLYLANVNGSTMEAGISDASGYRYKDFSERLTTFQLFTLEADKSTNPDMLNLEVDTAAVTETANGSNNFTGNLPNAKFYLGYSTAVFSDGDFQLLRLLVYSVIHSGAERSQVEDELGSLYGLAYVAPPDPDPPEVSIISPENDDIVSEEMDVEVSCEDIGNGVSLLQPKIDGTDFGTPHTGSNITSYTFNNLDISEIENGEHELSMVAGDGVNETESDPKIINVQNPPKPGFSIPSTGVVGVPVTITDLSVNAESFAYDKENNGSTDSTDAEPEFTFDTPGTYTVKQTVTNEFGSNYTTHNIVILDVVPLNYGFSSKEVEIFCEAQNLEFSDGNNVTSFTDQSIHGRNLTASGSYPTFQTNEINSKPVVRFNSSNPLKNTDEFTIRCGWILAKYDGATFPDTSDGYKGLLSDLVDKVILSGKRNTNEFFDADFEMFEFRSNDRICSEDENFELHAPAPMSSFKLIFFRFWKNLEVSGIQLGQELSNASRKWSGDVALLILTSRDFCEKQIREKSEAIAEAYNLTLADVIPFQASKSDETTYDRAVNVYDPPEGARIAEVLDEVKQSFDLNFNFRRNDEFKQFRAYYKTHYPEIPCVYRDYNVLPPEDVEGYFDSALRKTGNITTLNYSVRFKEE